MIERVQIRHPVTGQWVLLDTRTGRVVKTRARAWPGVTKRTAR